MSEFDAFNDDDDDDVNEKVLLALVLTLILVEVEVVRMSRLAPPPIFLFRVIKTLTNESNRFFKYLFLRSNAISTAAAVVK